MGEPPRGLKGPGSRPMEEKERGRLVRENGGIHKHAVRGSETSGGVWRVADAGNVQMGSSLNRNRKWGPGDI